MPFPLIKLGYLAIRQLSKPLANAVKRGAQRSPFFRKQICVRAAQWYHNFETRGRLRLLGMKPEKVNPLNEDTAVQVGGDILGEMLLFAVGGAVYYAEYLRSVKKERSKEDVQNNKLLDLQDRVIELELRQAKTDAQIREYERKYWNTEEKHQRLEQTLADKFSDLMGNINKR